MEAYLDNSATTRPCSAARQAMIVAMDTVWGNPSSLHQKGMDAGELLRDARTAVANALSCRPKEIVFTSGGTEANNLAVFGAAHAGRKRGRRVVVSAVEHPSVMKAFERLRDEGFDVCVLPVDAYGKISLADAETVIDEETILVSVMAVNNELGTIEPVEDLRRIIRSKHAPALLHIDAVQAFGKLPLSVNRLGADLLTVSAHKIHGPKGVGALFVKDGVRLVPTAVGGEQETRVRPGTEPMIAIAGFGAAVKAMRIPPLETIRELTDDFKQRLSALPEVVFNSGEDALPYIINFSLPGWKAETVLNFLSDRGIYVSVGSACAKGHRSPVLTAAGLDVRRMDSAIRVSLSDETTAEELAYCADGIAEAIRTLRKIS